ncbi:CBS domain-containing protein [Streptomyces sp. NBC_01233]|uniref:CBS domain-containing protein n=1 Tax=Streptomyces sp. NBC_01233 TaxID=2903787 RepID=UPI002E10BBCD|nr:CBS domain-containing protein [Streptomyces sp. NBC_01233]
MSKKVREIMTGTPVKVGKLSSLHEAARRMREDDIGDVLVMDDGHLAGLLTDRDLVVRAIADGMDPEQTTVSEICSKQMVTMGPDEDAERAVELMREHALRRLPVVEDDRPIGIVSLGDLAIDRDRHSALADISAAQPNT